MKIGAEAAQFPEKGYINGIAVAVCSLRCWCAVASVPAMFGSALLLFPIR